jgi:hypothetical protein
MPRTHPHAVATYRVISLGDGSFGIEVTIPESCPTTVTKFASEAEAVAWIARHRDRVNAEGQSGRWFRKTGRPGPETPGAGAAVASGEREADPSAAAVPNCSGPPTR